MGGEVHSKSRRRRSVSIKGHTRKPFSGFRFGTSHKSEIEEAQYLSTHFPKDRNCEVRKRTKITRAPCRKRTGDPVLRRENFGDLITADLKVLNEGTESRNNHRFTVVVQDLATQWMHSYSLQNQNISGDGKEFTKVSRAVGKAESHLYRQFFGIWQIL